MKLYYKTILFLLVFFPKISIAQLSVCYDSDGYTNARKLPSINSKLVSKIIEGQVFSIATYTQEENKSIDWIAINFSLTKNLSENNFLKFDGGENLGYVHKSRLVNLESLTKLKMTEIDNTKVFHSNEDLQVSIETQVFKKLNHKITQTKEGFFLVDGKKAYPYYGEENITEIKNITLKTKNKTYSFPEESFKNLFRINAFDTKVYKGNKGEYYLVFDAGDGSDGYNIAYCLKNNNLFSMTITSTLP
ncbi:hypothetical protein QMK33_00445 [Hymenobacter sp. H14-R3]|uniref:hypothetical protein n=1 Tax=Hymenobacter sp. H14-R3 TaxID=3046308 RepID=UPI0024BA18F3|nr:hypothetical protein [Hymenobacter sp. H14-R3]MDJ0363603.1 hypothetical protein [Hymenobacter sp. H14-R3]